jgi:hypothetical protein
MTFSADGQDLARLTICPRSALLRRSWPGRRDRWNGAKCIVAKFRSCIKSRVHGPEPVAKYFALSPVCHCALVNRCRALDHPAHSPPPDFGVIPPSQTTERGERPRINSHRIVEIVKPFAHRVESIMDCQVLISMQKHVNKIHGDHPDGRAVLVGTLEEK